MTSRNRFWLALGLAATCLTGAAWAQRARAQVSERTLRNLEPALHREAFAHAKYLLYARHANRTGHLTTAMAFERAAAEERLEHFAREAELAGLVGDDRDNLREAIAAESYEVDSLYPALIADALKGGDKEAAAAFSRIAREERDQRDLFEKELDALPSAVSPKLVR